jgi:hypothetical protein
VMKGGMSLNGGVYQKDQFLYQSTHVDSKIPPGEYFRVDMLSNERDRLRFYLRERVDCAWLPKTQPKPKPTDPVINPPEEPEPVYPAPKETRLVHYANLSSCGHTLPGAQTPPLAGAVLGESEIEHKPDGATFFRTGLTNLPTAAELAAQPWLDDAGEALYVVWLTRRVAGAVHVLPLAVIAPAGGERVLKRSPMALEAVKSIHGDAGILIDDEGNAVPYAEPIALAEFEGVVVTLQPDGNLETPSDIVIVGGAR